MKTIFLIEESLNEFSKAEKPEKIGMRDIFMDDELSDEEELDNNDDDELLDDDDLETDDLEIQDESIKDLLVTFLNNQLLTPEFSRLSVAIRLQKTSEVLNVIPMAKIGLDAFVFKNVDTNQIKKIKIEDIILEDDISYIEDSDDNMINDNEDYEDTI